jgi:hypothetical protein
MKKIAIFSFLFFSLTVIFFLLMPIKSEERHSNLFESFSFGAFQDQHEKHLRQNLTDRFNIKLGLVYEALCKKAFNNSDQLLKLSSDVVEKRISCTNGVFQIINRDTLLKVSELSLKFRITDSEDYYLLKISIKPFNNISLIKVENGLQKQLKNQNTLLWDSRDIRSDIFTFYFKKYLLFMNGDRLIAFYSCLENSASGSISFSAISEKKAIKVEIIHSTLDANAVSYLEQELMFSRLIPDSYTYHWNAYYPEHLIPINTKNMNSFKGLSSKILPNPLSLFRPVQKQRGVSMLLEPQGFEYLLHLLINTFIILKGLFSKSALNQKPALH